MSKVKLLYRVILIWPDGGEMAANHWHASEEDASDELNLREEDSTGTDLRWELEAANFQDGTMISSYRLRHRVNPHDSAAIRPDDLRFSGDLARMDGIDQD